MAAASTAARILLPRPTTVSSEGQRFARFDLGNPDAERGHRPLSTSIQSKRANLYFATELQRRADAAGLGLRSMAVAPGRAAAPSTPTAPTAPAPGT